MSSEAVVLDLVLKLFSLCLPVESHLAVLLPVIQPLRFCAVVRSALVIIIIIVILNNFALVATFQTSLLSPFLQIVPENKTPKVLKNFSGDIVLF